MCLQSMLMIHSNIGTKITIMKGGNIMTNKYASYHAAYQLHNRFHKNASGNTVL